MITSTLPRPVQLQFKTAFLLVLLIIVSYRLFDGILIERLLQIALFSVVMLLYLTRFLPKRNFFIYLVALALLVAATTTNLATKSANLGGLLIIFLCLSGFIVSKQLNSFSRLALSLFLSGYILLTSYSFILLFIIGENSGDIFRGSRNHITTVFLSLYTLCFIPLDIERRKRNLKYTQLLFLATTLIAAYIIATGTGRVGLAIGAFLTTHAALFVLKEKNLLLPAALLSIIPTIYFLYFFNLTSVFKNIDSFYRLTSQGTESIRWDINTHFLDNLINLKYLTGYPDQYWIDKFGMGSHNSFIEIYSLFGTTGSIFILLLIFIAVWRAKSYFFYTTLIAALTFRSFFDTTISSLDFGIAFFSILFFSMDITRQLRTNNARHNKINIS